MSVASILGADGRIAASFLPVGTANNYVDNPMTETLNGGTFGMTNVGTVSCGAITSTGATTLGSISSVGAIASTGNITATGTIVPSQWNGFPQSPSGTVVSLVGNASLNFVNILSANLTPGTYLITISFEFEKLGTSTPSNGISIQYITAGAAEVLLLDTTEGDLEAQGYTTSFLYNTPVSGGFTVQLNTSALPVGQTYQITSYAGGQGFIKLT